MTALNAVILLVFVLTFFVLNTKALRRNIIWSATITPLASIIGSGFLVSVPLLAGAIGVWAVAAVAGLLGLAYLLGGAIRYNIAYAEPAFEAGDTHRDLRSLETLSHVVLTGAYFISVAYYLVLLATFGLKLAGLDNPLAGKLIASGLIATISLIGLIKDLHGIESTEKFTVSANMAAIAAMLAALVVFGVALPQGVSWGAAAKISHEFDWHTLRFLLGLLIIVQGFETTRFMGQLYDRKTRIRAMKAGQITAAIIYMVFFVLMIPLFPEYRSSADVAATIEVLARVSPWLPFVVAGGAIASQFSAAVADSIGASGLIRDTSNRRISPKHAYALIGTISILVIWETDVVSIVALASRAFALFYALQCVVAAMLAWRRGERGRSGYFSILAGISLAITGLGIPAGG